MRLNRYLAASGVSSRRAAEALILAGRVSINGTVVTALATFVEPDRDHVEVDGQRVRPPRTVAVLLLNKPVGVVTTADDPHGRPTVLRFVPTHPRVFPVGRLDRDSTGALILTNDGDLAHRILHPRYRLEKEYLVWVDGAVTDPQLEALRRGIRLPGETRRTAPAQFDLLERRPQRTRLRVVLHEGRKRQIRRMLEAVGHRVQELTRVRIGPVRLETLAPGEYRELTPDELTELRRMLERPSGRPNRPRRRVRRQGGERKPDASS